MDEKKVLEEQLREASCIGDTDAVQQLINLGVDVNTKHSINGWTPLHWACKRNYLDVVSLLLRNGADPKLKASNGETPASVCTNPLIMQLLGTTTAADYLLDGHKEQEVCDFVPNYIKNAPVVTKLDIGVHKRKPVSQEVNESNQEEMTLKIRIANSSDQDFIEVDLSRSKQTFNDLIKLCCDELDIKPSQVFKLRKLPNTKIRRDKDVQRLQDFQEIEVVLYPAVSSDNETTIQKSVQQSNGSASLPITPTNNYQSISKKDQTILY